MRREDFDADLVAQARARGIEIVEGEGVDAFTVDAAARRVSLTTSRGRALQARVLVGADGAGSRVRKALAARRRRRRAAVVPLRLFRAEIPAPAALQLGERMIYDFSPMDHGLRGYVWLFPVAGDRVNVGVMHYPSRHLPAPRSSGCCAARWPRTACTWRRRRAAGPPGATIRARASPART